MFSTPARRSIHLPALDKLLEPMQQLIVPSAAPPIAVEDVWDVEVHVPIVEALRTKDAEAMQAALERHYKRSRDSAPKDWLSLGFRHAAAASRGYLERHPT